MASKSQKAQFGGESGSLTNKLQSLLSAMLQEIRDTEDAISTKDRESAAGVDDYSCPLGTILQIKREQSELKAYLHGLQFSYETCDRFLRKG